MFSVCLILKNVLKIVMYTREVTFLVKDEGDKVMVKRFIAVLVAVAISVVSFAGLASAQDATRPTGPILQRILDRGELICGVNAALRGFGFQDANGQFSGFDVDFCRALAAAIFGDASKVQYRPLSAGERQAAIQSGEIDVMIRNTTNTLSRDIDWGATFGPTIFYDGAGFMTTVSQGATTFTDLDGTTTCVQSGTTTELFVTDYITVNNLDIEILKFDDANATWEAYLAGRCESWSTDKSGLAGYRSGAENPADHVILPDTISKEPLAPLSPENDTQFASLVAWVVYGMIQAEESGVTSENVADFVQGADESSEAYTARVLPTVARLLGQNNNNAGVFFNIPNDFMVAVISQVGNYGEVYARNLNALGLVREGSANDLWSRGGLIYSPPFR